MMEYNVRHTGDVTILDLNGRLSLAEALAFGPGSGLVLGETVRDLAKKGQKKLLLNLAGVTYVDSSGMGQLVGAITSARNQGSNVKLLNPAGQVLYLLETTHLHKVFEIHSDEAAAIQSFSQGASTRM